MADSDLTIDELARQAGLPSSTIRLYQTKGLLPGPRKAGRVAFYGAGHVARLDLIARLQARGFSLAAIAELVTGWESGRGLEEVLGLEGTVSAGLLGPAGPPLVVGLDELLARFPTVTMTPQLLQRIQHLGLVSLTEDNRAVVIHAPDFLGVGQALVDLGFPLDEVLDEYAALAGDMEAVATRFAGLFERHVWQPFAAAGMPPADLPAVSDVLDKLGPLADRIVHAALRQALGRVAERFLADQAAATRAAAGSRPRRGSGRGSTRRARGST